MIRKPLLLLLFACLMIGYGQTKTRVVQRTRAKARASPRVLNYQGYLTDTLGSPLDDTLDMTFTIYDAGIDGNELWTETQSLILVERGVFSVLLGSVTEIPDSVFLKGTMRWLELILESADTLSPRTRITVMAYAYTATHATHADTADYALTTQLGGVPSGYCILGASGTPPAGYTCTQNYVTAADPSVNGWTTKASMLQERRYFGAASVGGKIYAMGGDPNRFANEEYDPVTNTWTVKEDWEDGEEKCAVAAVNGKIYALGGDGSLDINTEYDPATDSWTDKADMLTGRHSLAAAGVNGKIYAIGGFDNITDLQTNEEYDPVSNSWATKANMPTSRYGLAAAVVNGKIYVIGGKHGSSYNNNNQEYDPVTNSWTYKAVMPTARYYLAAAAVNGKIYAIGGWNSDGTYLATTEEYNPVNNTWNTKSDMPTARMALAAAEAMGRIYAIGGENGGIPVDNNEEYGAGVVFYYIHRKN